MPEREVVHHDESLLTRVKPVPLVAVGSHKNSQIDLYTVKYDGIAQSSVFVYPSWYALRREGIPELDALFSEVSQRIISKTFKNTSVEDLDRAFIDSAKRGSLISMMNHPYLLHKPVIYEHSFAQGTSVFLEDIIRELQVN